MDQTLKNFGGAALTNLASLCEWGIIRWKWVWLAVSVGGIIFSVAYSQPQTVAFWTLSTILSVITVGGWWKGVLRYMSKAVSFVFKKILTAMSGSYGADVAVLTMTITLVSLAVLLQTFPGICPEPVEVASMILPLSGWLFAGAVLTGAAIVPLFIKRLAK